MQSTLDVMKVIWLYGRSYALRHCQRHMAYGASCACWPSTAIICFITLNLQP